MKYGDATIDRVPGVYRAKFTKLDLAFPVVDRETGEEQLRWRWVFQDVNDSTTVGEIDTITNRHFKQRSNGLKFLTGMLGRQPQPDDDTDTLIGKIYDVTWGPNQNGRNTIVAVTKVGKSGDDLPFPADDGIVPEAGRSAPKPAPLP